MRCLAETSRAQPSHAGQMRYGWQNKEHHFEERQAMMQRPSRIREGSNAATSRSCISLASKFDGRASDDLDMLFDLDQCLDSS